MTTHTHVFKYVAGSGQDTWGSPRLADKDEVHASFKTPADLYKGGKGGWVAFANQGMTGAGNNSNDIEMALSENEGDFSGRILGALTGTIYFNTKSWFGGAAKNVLKPDTVYWINLRTLGPAPDGIRVKLKENKQATADALEADE